MKTKKQIQKKIKDSSPIEQRFGVFVEHMDKRFDQVFEGHDALVAGQEKLEKELKDFRHETISEIRVINFNLGNTNTNLKDLTVKVEDLTVKVDKLGADNKSIFEYLSRMDDELASIRSDITEVKAKIPLVSAEKLAELEKRVHAMEAKLASYKSFK